jgi:hypothetical protein
MVFNVKKLLNDCVDLTLWEGADRSMPSGIRAGLAD